MKIELKKIKLSEIFSGYRDQSLDEKGIVGYYGKLNIRPAYQREFVYKEDKRDAVIRSVLDYRPLNVMYWAVNPNDEYEIIDGQQRTISICQFMQNSFSILINGSSRNFNSLSEFDKERFKNYELFIYWCEGSDSEKLEWFKTINISAEPLTIQELRNAIYTGEWLTAAKIKFSRSNALAVQLAKGYMKGEPLKQIYLESAISWVAMRDNNTDSPKEKEITEYMNQHRFDHDAQDLWVYFQEVISWAKKYFTDETPYLKSQNWGYLYFKYHKNTPDPETISREIKKLIEDEEVDKSYRIYEYVLSKDEKYLSFRGFPNSIKVAVYSIQEGNCKKCGRHFPISEMHADHIKPWSKGGKSTIDNCQMLCQRCNAIKSDSY